MRAISDQELYDAIYGLALKLPVSLRPDVIAAIRKARDQETSEKAKHLYSLLLQNTQIAEEERIPLCQDTGAVSVFLKVGLGASFQTDPVITINKAIANAYRDGLYRASIVEDALIGRSNTGNNTPAFISFEYCDGAGLEISMLIKGGGCDNASSITMLKPTASIDEIADVAANALINAGPNACPPFIAGVLVGGTFDTAPALSKKLLFKDLTSEPKDQMIAELERKIYAKVNASGIGPGGFGGATTLLRAFVGTAPSHIASLPVAVNISCHSLRSGTAKII